MCAALLLALSSCGGEPVEAVEADPGPWTSDPGSALSSPPAHDLEGLGEESGSAVVLARVRGRRLAFVADTDDSSVIAFDPAARRELVRTRLPGVPTQLLVARDGRLFAALREGNAVVVLESTGSEDGALVLRARVATRDEPVGLALARDGETLLVASAWGHGLEGFSTSSLAKQLSVDLPREPRAIALSADGATAFVSHAAGSILSAVDLRSGSTRALPLGGGDVLAALPESILECLRPDDPAKTARAHAIVTKRAGVQGFSLARLGDRLFAPEALVRTGDPSEHTDGYGHMTPDLPSQIFGVAVVEAGKDAPARASVRLDAEHVASAERHRPPCLLPRAAVADPARGSIFVACADLGMVLELDASKDDPARAEKRRFRTAAGPVGLALDAGSAEAFAWSQFGRTLVVISLGDPAGRPANERPYGSTQIAADQEAVHDDNRISIGRALFHLSGDPRIAKDGRACASCHPDGRDDGLTWPTPSGPRQPPMLAGRLAGTAPYSWSGGHASLREHLKKTIESLHGTGLDERSSDALVTYLATLRGPVRSARPLDEKERRGHELFASAEVGCAGCHQERSAWTDGSMHDVSSRAPGDRSTTFDTPSLRFVGGTAPYFHDGRYASLRGLLRDKPGAMGNTAGLAERDLDALEAYLRTL